MSKYCQNPRESSFSSSQYSNHYYNNYSISDDNYIDGTTPIRSSSSSSLSTTVERSCCHPYNILGSKLGSGLFSNQQQCFGHLQSLFAKKNNSIIGALKNRFMATPTGEFFPSENTRKKKLISGHQIKREELEREVSMLQNMLHQEEKVHQVLEHVHNQRNGSIPIPNFLPPKTKNLLAELAMVEGEITKLEGQISKLKLGLKKEQESANKESNAKQWRFGSPIRSVCNPSSFTFPSPINNNSNNVTGAQNDKINIGYETKSMHFISKAMKSDYGLSEFSVNERRANSKGSLSDHQKENVLPRKTGLLKSVSPLRDPRTPSPRPMRGDTPPKLMSTLLLEETVQNWQPNKLSEEIMKCLNFIYIRLHRTTRTMELEKSGPVARSLHPTLSSRSFRTEAAGSNSSKESRQRDPYGIFNDEDSIPRDIGPYKNLVIFAASSMDPKSVSSPSFVPLLRKLRLLTSNLQTVELRSLTYQHKLAFWINMYNACIMHAFIQYGVPSTHEKLLTLMNKAILNVGGNIINAQAIEHYILRPSSNNEANKNNGERDNKESIVRDLYGLETTEPNVVFALCSGARSSPAVRVYTAENVGSELERSKVEYLQASVMVTSTKRIALPELLLRNTLDFAADKEMMVEWVCHQLPTSGSLRKSIMDCFRTSHTTSGRIISSATVDKIPYDYEFQYLLAI